MSAVPGLLAVIDMQRVFAEPDSPWAAPRFDEAAAGVRRLLPAFAGRTVFTRFVAPEHPQGAWRAYYDRWPFALRPPDAPLWQLVDELAHEAGTWSTPPPSANGARSWPPAWARTGGWSWPGSAPTAVCCPRPSRRQTRASRYWWPPTPARARTTSRTPRPCT